MKAQFVHVNNANKATNSANQASVYVYTVQISNEDYL